MFLELELLNKEPMNGIVGIDLRTVPRVRGKRDLYWIDGRYGAFVNV